MRFFVTIEEILDSGYWIDFCNKYGYSEYAVNEGINENEEIEITEYEAREWGLL